MNIKKLLAFFAIACFLFACKKEDDNILPADKSFPIDREFEELLVFMKIDPLRNGLIRQSDIIRIDSLNLSGAANVRSLRGIEHFENLRALVLFNIQIDSLDLNANTKLEYVRIETVGPEGAGQSLKFLDVANCKKLRYLNCRSNLLKKIDISQNTLLRELHCGDNPELTQLNLNNNPELEVLNCGQTKIRRLDLGKNTRLSRVECPLTPISDLDVSMLQKLKAFDCRETNIKTLNIKSPQTLEELYITRSKIGKIDFSMYRNVWSLAIGDNLYDFDLRPLKLLKILDCFDMRSPEIDLSGNENLETLSTRLCDFTELDLSGNKNLKHLFLVQMKNISSLDLTNQNLTSFSSIFNYNLKTICVNKIPNSDDLNWGEESWTTYKICK